MFNYEEVTKLVSENSVALFCGIAVLYIGVKSVSFAKNLKREDVFGIIAFGFLWAGGIGIGVCAGNTKYAPDKDNLKLLENHRVTFAEFKEMTETPRDERFSIRQPFLGGSLAASICSLVTGAVLFIVACCESDERKTKERK